eukprot:1145010-Pelagomonas_calceolata.AAC.4
MQAVEARLEELDELSDGYERALMRKMVDSEEVTRAMCVKVSLVPFDVVMRCCLLCGNVPQPRWPTTRCTGPRQSHGALHAVPHSVASCCLCAHAAGLGLASSKADPTTIDAQREAAPQSGHRAGKTAWLEHHSMPQIKQGDEKRKNKVAQISLHATGEGKWTKEKGRMA